jgi:alpha 1,3-glucosidase
MIPSCPVAEWCPYQLSAAGFRVSFQWFSWLWWWKTSPRSSTMQTVDTTASGDEDDDDDMFPDAAAKDNHTADAASKHVEEATEPDGFWQENFQTHEDRKPHGELHFHCGHESVIVCAGSSSIGMDISLVGFEHVYGLPEHADSFALRSTV